MKFLKSIVHIFLFILLFIWQLPQNLMALFMLPFIGEIDFISYKKFCFAFKAEKIKTGLSLGNFAFINPVLAKKVALVKHEQEGHSYDSKIFGPLYLPVIGIPIFLHSKSKKNKGYYDFYTERRANKHAGLEVLETTNGRCFLSVKNVLGYTRK